MSLDTVRERLTDPWYRHGTELPPTVIDEKCQTGRALLAEVARQRPEDVRGAYTDAADVIGKLLQAWRNTRSWLEDERRARLSDAEAAAALLRKRESAAAAAGSQQVAAYQASTERMQREIAALKRERTMLKREIAALKRQA